MKELEDGVVRYPWSSKPWKHWNTFIFWHSSNYPWIKWDYNEVFANLNKLSYWDEIIVYYWQKKYIYVVREKRVISPWETKILKRNQKKDELTLMTCWPVGTTLDRLIVISELKK
jgi:LPXTG-site transpeptidase (sortase) family protein